MNKKFPWLRKEDAAILILILLGTALFWVPYMTNDFTKGAEIEFHYARIMTLADSLKSGIFPAKIRPTHMKNFGYGIGFFYPDILIYPPAAAIALGAGYDITIKIYLFVVTFILSIVTYRNFRLLTGNRWIALAGEVLVMNSAINDQNIFDGGGMPHLFAYLFLPLALCGLLRALKNEKGAFAEFAIGISMVLLTHDMIFLTMLFSMIFMVLFSAKNIVEKPVVFLKLIGVSVAAMITTTAYWLPALEQISHIRFIVFNDNAYSVTDHILRPEKLFLQDIGILYTCIFVLAAIVYGILIFKKRKMPTDIHAIFCTSIIVIVFSCSRTIWLSKVGEILSFFEYTDRFEFVLVVMLIMFVIMTIREAADEFSKELAAFNMEKLLLSVLVSLIFIVATRYAARPGFMNPDGEDRIHLYYDLLMEDWQVSGAEWLPVECEPTECKEPEKARANDKSSADGFKHDGAKYFEVWVDMSKEYYDMPYVYYYGYHAYVIDENNNPVKELEVGEAFDDNGYVRVFLPEGGEGIAHILTTYRKTPIQKLSYRVSALSILVLAVLMCVRKFAGLRR